MVMSFYWKLKSFLCWRESEWASFFKQLVFPCDPSSFNDYIFLLVTRFFPPSQFFFQTTVMWPYFKNGPEFFAKRKVKKKVHNGYDLIWNLSIYLVFFSKKMREGEWNWKEGNFFGPKSFLTPALSVLATFTDNGNTAYFYVTE